jgi:hypothetical protein
MSDRADTTLPPLPTEPVRPREKPDRTLAAIVLLAALSLAGTFALLPSSEEKAAGLFEEERYDEAIDMLVALDGQRPLNAYEGYMLFKLYLLTRQPDNAAALMRDAALPMDRAWALGELATLYRQVGDLGGEAEMLRPLYEMTPTDTGFSRLRAIYRLRGDAANEASLLSGAIAAGIGGTAYAKRLAYLQSLPASGGSSALWTAASTSNSVAAPGIKVLAVSPAPSAQSVSIE